MSDYPDWREMARDYDERKLPGVVYQDVVPTCGTCGALLDEKPEAAAGPRPTTPQARDEGLLGTAWDASLQAHGFMHYGSFADCQARICVHRRGILEPAIRAALAKESE